MIELSKEKQEGVIGVTGKSGRMTRSGGGAGRAAGGGGSPRADWTMDAHAGTWQAVSERLEGSGALERNARKKRG